MELDEKTINALRELGVSEEQIAQWASKEAIDEKSAGAWPIARKRDEKKEADKWAAAGAEAARVVLRRTAMKRQMRTYTKSKAAATATGRFLASVGRAVNACQARRRRQLR